MIVVSGGAEASPEQMAYLFGQKVACGGGSAEDVALVEQYWAQSRNATDYDDYREAAEILIGIRHFGLHTGVNLEIAEEDDWTPRKRDTDSFFDPTVVLEHTTIPVLAFFGELDKNIDPVQGAEAYEAALQKSENQDYQVVTIPGVAHTLVSAKTGCLNESWSPKLAPEYLEILGTWLQHLSQ
jgi:pimeloyl-ACP methyl ester carboxylesterase